MIGTEIIPTGSDDGGSRVLETGSSRLLDEVIVQHCAMQQLAGMRRAEKVRHELTERAMYKVKPQRLFATNHFRNHTRKTFIKAIDADGNTRCDQ
jgi:hypothetical protein